MKKNKIILLSASVLLAASIGVNLVHADDPNPVTPPSDERPVQPTPPVDNNGNNNQPTPPPADNNGGNDNGGNNNGGGNNQPTPPSDDGGPIQPNRPGQPKQPDPKPAVPDPSDQQPAPKAPSKPKASQKPADQVAKGNGAEPNAADPTISVQGSAENSNNKAKENKPVATPAAPVLPATGTNQSFLALIGTVMLSVLAFVGFKRKKTE